MYYRGYAKNIFTLFISDVICVHAPTEQQAVAVTFQRHGNPC